MSTPQAKTRRPVHALTRLAGSAWAMRPDALAALAHSAQTLATSRRPSRVSALRSQEGETLDGTRRVRVADGIATLRVSGPLFHHDELLAWWFDGATYEALARDLRLALDASGVRRIVLEFDTPGGQVSGCDEFAQMIRATTEEKPITALVIGDACSAGYLLASACEEVVAVQTAIVGCLGVQVIYLDDSGMLEQFGLREIQIVSSQTPRKNAPPTEDVGRNDAQRMVDDLAAVMLARIADWRGVDPDDVATQFGAGAVLVGERAEGAGMVDRLMTSDALYTELAGRPASGPSLTAAAVPRSRRTAAGSSPTQEQSMPPEEQAAATTGTAQPPTQPSTPPSTPPAAELQDGPTAGAALAERYPQAAAALRAEGRAEGETAGRTAGATAERERIVAIQRLAIPGHEATVAACVADASCTPADAALRLAEAERAGRTNALAGRRGDELNLTPPAPLAEGAPGAATSTANLVQQILGVHAQVNPGRTITPTR